VCANFVGTKKPIPINALAVVWRCPPWHLAPGACRRGALRASACTVAVLRASSVRIGADTLFPHCTGPGHRPRFGMDAAFPDRGVNMLKVILINDGTGQVASLRRTLTQAGLEVIAELEPAPDMAAAVARLEPDVVLIDSDAPGRDVLEEICVASAHSARPVVMFTGQSHRDVIRGALEAGVAA